MQPPFFHKFEEDVVKKLHAKIGLKLTPRPLLAVSLAGLVVCLVLAPQVVISGVKIAFFVAPIWLPFLIISGAYKMWYIYKRSYFLANQKYVLLEIKPPRNVVKTPAAMEAFLSILHLTGGESTWYDRLRGGTRPYWSLEIASFEGQVHFFLWIRSSLRRMVESQMYAQYPGVQLIESPDYTRLISAKPGEWFVWGTAYTKAPNDDPYPIKTYVDFGLDKVQKEPEQVDPIAHLVEFMSSIGKGEYLWLQMVIRAHKGEKYGITKPNGKPYTWLDRGEEIVNALRQKTRESFTDPVTGAERHDFPNPTKGEQEKMLAIERQTMKLGFDVGMRCIYIAKPDRVQGPTISHIIGLFKPFSTEGWNGINSSKGMKTFDDYPWEIGVEKRKNRFRRELVEAYRRRAYFYDPFYEGDLPREKVMVMSSEELATVFHIPSLSTQAPGLERMASATGEAPANLPT
ncbi:hypothetical protein COU19_01500 [Candidatus Kaiserbacteria bacterium CG10_big_fil_rev_8_21_14_0_10_56_12]|uniref:DUF8128 domain-containing protein n=1 Tax=Candidatus Kaiserbacteria bacterium CG10_big_fil_rev_8_21_14_0_10_56_12 TaxID=1974611 RepID=A0A2H0UA15_9BACT|nr:MAG: hypothetical protein COU19_01500 [Candidatus Kaiserbacteria bacterium CG10_big_fil_rev_8_21_14_0_10_56_12]